MHTSTLFAAIAGPMFIICGLGVLLNQDNYKKILDQFADNPLLVYLAGFMALTLGLIAIQLHNKWVWNWSLIITLLCWLTAIKGACLILFPGYLARLGAVYKKSSPLLALNAVILFALGVFLTVMACR